MKTGNAVEVRPMIHEGSPGSRLPIKVGLPLLRWKGLLKR